MEIVRYIFFIIILICSTSIGFLLSKKYADRVDELNSFSNLINILKNKIRFTKMPLIDAFDELSNIEKNPIISNIFLDFSKQIKNKKTQDAWNQLLEEKRKRLSLKEEDIKLIKKLGNILGKTDIEGQISGIDEFNINIQNQIKKAEEERKKSERMHRNLGAIIGLVIIIVLF